MATAGLVWSDCWITSVGTLYIKGRNWRTGPYDITIDKFSRLDSCQETNRDEAACTDRRPRTDCRRYFDAYATHLARQQQAMERMTELEREMYEARALESLVRHHFKLALRECQRTSFMTRFVWRRPTGELVLKMPRSTLWSGQAPVARSERAGCRSAQAR